MACIMYLARAAERGTPHARTANPLFTLYFATQRWPPEPRNVTDIASIFQFAGDFATSPHVVGRLTTNRLPTANFAADIT